jgi:hypothetical protein
MKKVYLVLSQTHSGIARTIKAVTHEKYSHASIALDPKCEEMYSFGRKYRYFPFLGIFKKEDLNKGLFKNKGALISIYEIDITEEQFEKIKSRIRNIKKTNKGYNIIGLLLAYFRIKLNRNKYYCSEFVYEVFSSKGIDIYDNNKIRFQPMELIDKNFKKIYEGEIRDFLKTI